MLFRVLDLGGQSQSSLLPLGLSRKRLLLISHIDTSRVYLIIASCLEKIKRLVEGIQVGDSGAIVLVRSKGHQTQDDAWFYVLNNKRHGCCCVCVVKYGCCCARVVKYSSCPRLAQSVEWRGINCCNCDERGLIEMTSLATLYL